VYRDVRLKNPSLKGQRFLEAVREHYRKRRVKKFRAIPMALQGREYDTEAGAQRNLLRYLKRAESIMLNVAKGEFPGKYQ
jgi:hypothetical protein